MIHAFIYAVVSICGLCIWAAKHRNEGSDFVLLELQMVLQLVVAALQALHEHMNMLKHVNN
jgi:hypothetical protein